MNTYNRVLIFCYPPDAGGKFLNNCLALNQQFVFNNEQLAYNQLNNNFNIQDKIDYLHSRLDLCRDNKKWDDLDLGCLQITGLTTLDYVNEYPEIINLRLKTVIEKIINANLWFGLCAHSLGALDVMLKFWINAKVIFLTNNQEFIQARQKSNNQDPLSQERELYWEKIKGQDWPQKPPCNLLEFDSLKDFVKQELVNQKHGLIFSYFDRRQMRINLFEKYAIQSMAKLENRYYNWNTDVNYSTLANFLPAFQDCCQWLDVQPACNDQLSKYFQRWKSIISQC